MSKLLGLAKTAYQADTPEKYLIDSATLYRNLSFDPTSSMFHGELIGATNGGVEIDITQKYRDVDVDGTYWTPVKGNKVLSSTEVTAKANVKEVTAETLALSINGTNVLVADANEAPAGYSVVTGKRYVEDNDYIDNVAIVGKISGTDKPIIFILDNCLSTAGAKIKTVDDKEAEIPLELTAHADYDQLVNDVFPYRIYYPTMGGEMLTSIALDVNGSTPATALVAGNVYTVKVTPTPSNASVPDLAYISTNKSVAIIDQAGAIRAIGAGTAEIIALTRDGQFSATLSVTVIAPTPVTGVTSSPVGSSASPISVAAGAKGTIAVGTGTGTASAIIIKLTPASANNYSVAFASDSAHVTVDPVTGDYEAVDAGTAKVTATITNLSDNSTVHTEINFTVTAP